jgi:DNA primase
MAYSDDDKRRVLEATDIVGLIGEHVALKRVGRRWTAICPFHSEDTPSLSVNAEQGLYYCFGCHASGDSLTFVMETYRMGFQEALEHLAQRAHITLTPLSKADSESRSRREQLLGIVGRAAELYVSNLEDPVIGARAREYLSSRGISGEAIRHFRIGFAPSGGRNLMDQLRVPPQDLVDAGLAYLDDRQPGRARDHFYGRVMFPISDTSGRVIGFGGRILPELQSSREGSPPIAKYKNSPETEIYHKRRVLYGLDLARTEIVNSSEIVVCEGYTDVIGFWQSGVPRAVATCGTALSEEHFDRMKNFAKRIVLAFDADGAGQEAAERLYQMEQRHNLQIAVAKIPFGKDPGEVAATDPEALRRAVEEAEPFLAFRLRRHFARADLQSAEGRARAADEAIGMVIAHPNPLVRSDYIGLIADQTRLQFSELKARIDGRSVMRRSVVLQDRDADIETAFEDRVAVEAMRLLVHMPQDVKEFLVPALFRNDILRQLASEMTLFDEMGEAAAYLRDRKDPSALVFFRLATIAPQMDVFDVMSTFAVKEAKYELVLLTQRLRRGGEGLDLPALSRAVSRVNELIAVVSLRDEHQGVATGELIAWLTESRVEPVSEAFQ